MHHAYLFSGTRGIETTIARILAKAFNCQEGMPADTCGECGIAAVSMREDLLI